jgi:hypothetical protein
MELMEDKETQKIFEKAKDDSSSLYIFCDSVSFITKHTKTITSPLKLLMNFAIDARQLQRRVYSLTRRVATRQSRDDGDSNRLIATKSLKPSRAETEQAKRSARIDRDLEKDSHRLRREIQILAMGKDATALMKQMQANDENGYTQEDGIQLRPLINQYLLSTVRYAIDMAAATEAGSTVNIGFEHHKRILNSRKDVQLVDGFNSEERQSLWCCAKHLIRYYKFEGAQL